MSTKTQTLKYIQRIAERGIPRHEDPFFLITSGGFEFTPDADWTGEFYEPKYFPLDKFIRDAITRHNPYREYSKEELQKARKQVLGWLRLIEKELRKFK